MAVISITVTESPIQKVEGIPATIELSTNIPATIFYTLDGTDPTTSSDIYVSAITMPAWGAVTLKVFATDGVSSSSILTEEYGANMTTNRVPHAKVTLTNTGYAGEDLFPFGDVAPTQPVQYGALGGVDVDDPNTTGYSAGYDGTATGTSAAETDEEYNLTNYEIKYSDRDRLGQYEAIGTLPATVSIVVPPAPPEQSDANSKMFDPRALVIVQDGREPPEDPNISHINKQFFSLTNNERSKDGAYYRTTAFEGAVPTGSLVKYYYNPREDIYTFYYRDADSNRWIISKEPRTASTSRSISQIAFPSSSGRAGPKVFQWIPFKRSRLI